MKKIILVGVAIIIVAILCISGIFAYQKYLSPTAGWKTYTNTQYGFELKYPPALQIFENQKTGVEIFGVTFENSLANRQTSGRKVVFNVSVFDNSNQLQDAYKSLNLQDQGEIIISGHAATKLYRPTGPDYTTVYLIADKNLSIFSTDTNYNEISKTDIDLILSTFKFTK